MDGWMEGGAWLVNLLRRISILLFALVACSPPLFFCTKVRAIDKYLSVWIIVTLNAAIATLLREVGGFDLSKDVLTHWDTVRMHRHTKIFRKSLICCPHNLDTEIGSRQFFSIDCLVYWSPDSSRPTAFPPVAFLPLKNRSSYPPIPLRNDRSNNETQQLSTNASTFELQLLSSHALRYNRYLVWY